MNISPSVRLCRGVGWCVSICIYEEICWLRSVAAAAIFVHHGGRQKTNSAQPYLPSVYELGAPEPTIRGESMQFWSTALNTLALSEAIRFVRPREVPRGRGLLILVNSRRQDKIGFDERPQQRAREYHNKKCPPPCRPLRFQSQSFLLGRALGQEVQEHQGDG